jgi:hypothetical protein
MEEEGEVLGPRTALAPSPPSFERSNSFKPRSNDGGTILTRTGGAYIPPARLREMQDKISDKSSEAYQRMSWEALKKSINGLINKVNLGPLYLMTFLISLKVQSSHGFFFTLGKYFKFKKYYSRTH